MSQHRLTYMEPRAKTARARHPPKGKSRPSNPAGEGLKGGSSPFDVEKFLGLTGVARRIFEYRQGTVIYRQGDSCDSVFYVQKGGVKISVLSKGGRQAVVALLNAGEFFGLGGLAGQPVRVGSATASMDTTLMVVDQQEMIRVLHGESALSDRLLSYLLARTIRVEEELRRSG